jgi:putative hydrolase of the HAD superfamily
VPGLRLRVRLLDSLNRYEPDWKAAHPWRARHAGPWELVLALRTRAWATHRAPSGRHRDSASGVQLLLSDYHDDPAQSAADLWHVDRQGVAALIRFVTFDCAGTLVEVKCTVAHLLLRACQERGLHVGREEMQLFQALYVARLPAFHGINRLRDPEKGVEFWEQLSANWLSQIGEHPSLASDLRERVDDLAWSAPSHMFTLYDDVVPCLERLRAEGKRMAVISNWDYSLHRCLRMFHLEHYFEVRLASLEEGVEKPDSRLFELALEQLGATPAETAHVGDDPLDDVEGARRAGLLPVHLDRSGATGDAIRSLAELNL